ncbi:glycosyltransferase family 2 protein [Chitinophaga flava]|uniref:Glycosyltransferase n=1 Tax=Chitinophaga flava TaxID=2259036 RepID=A0A365Y6D8_9BACT|nr:glycosyltransferase family 2 protein [Chitinophaga flava]RBL93861.1 glycosyltransferase [Chitinophaga flava]
MENKLGMQETNKLVSIIIATYNSEKYIRECLSSILSLGVNTIEVVIVDGGSTDQTIDIVKSFDSRMVSWKSSPDKGIYDALNKGVERARGKWLYFMGADDRLLPGFAEMMQYLKDEHTVYYGNTTEFFEKEGPQYLLLKGEFNNYRLAKFCMNHQTILYPANVFKKYHYNLRYKVYADYALNIQVWGDKTFTKIHLPITIARYNMDGFSSLTKDKDFVFQQEKFQLVKRSMGWLIYLRLLSRKYKYQLRGKNWEQ